MKAEKERRIRETIIIHNWTARSVWVDVGWACWIEEPRLNRPIRQANSTLNITSVCRRACPERTRSDVNVWTWRHFVTSNWCHEEYAHAVGDRGACRHTLIKVNNSRAATDWNLNQTLSSAVFSNSSTHCLTPGRINEFKSFGHVENWLPLQENWPALDNICCLWWRGVRLKGNGGAAAAKGLFKSQWSTTGKRILLFILPLFLIWHTFCHSSFLSICPLPPPFTYSPHSVFLPLCGKCNGFLGSERDILSLWTIITRVRATSCNPFIPAPTRYNCIFFQCTL